MSNKRRRTRARPHHGARPTAEMPDEPFLLACVDMIRRTGPLAFQLRYSDDEQPVVWMAVAEYSGRVPAQVAAALTPTRAVFRLLENLIDGGTCQHCSRPTGITEHFAGMPVPEEICWYQFDPELKTFRRGCA